MPTDISDIFIKCLWSWLQAVPLGLLISLAILYICDLYILYSFYLVALTTNINLLSMLVI